MQVSKPGPGATVNAYKGFCADRGRAKDAATGRGMPCGEFACQHAGLMSTCAFRFAHELAVPTIALI